LRHFAVIGIEIGLRNRLVAATALVHDRELEPFLVGAADRMGAMTVVAHRQLLRGLPGLGDMHAAGKLFLHAMMAPTARGGDVTWIDARERIGAGKNFVRRVTTGTCRCHGQTTAGQPLAVSALTVMLDYLMLIARVPYRRLLAFTMASRTEGRNIGGKCGGGGLGLAENLMRSVAFLACRRIGIVPHKELSMRAQNVFPPDFGVTRCAIDALGDGLAGPLFRRIHAGMALATGNFCVP